MMDGFGLSQQVWIYAQYWIYWYCYLNSSQRWVAEITRAQYLESIEIKVLASQVSGEMDGGYTCALQGLGRQNKHCLNADPRWHKVTELLCLSLIVSTYRFWIELKYCRAGGVEHIKTIQRLDVYTLSLIINLLLLCYVMLNIPRLFNFIPAVAASTSLWFTELN